MSGSISGLIFISAAKPAREHMKTRKQLKGT